MTPLTRERAEKAEGDFVVASRELRSRRSPNFDASCFHSQQCAEKYMMGRLQEATVSFPKTHDLVQLLHLISPLEPALLPLNPLLDA